MIEDSSNTLFNAIFQIDESAGSISPIWLEPFNRVQTSLFACLEELRTKLALDGSQMAELKNFLALKSGIKEAKEEYRDTLGGRNITELRQDELDSLDKLYVAQYDRLNRCLYAVETVGGMADRSLLFPVMLQEFEAMLTPD